MKDILKYINILMYESDISKEDKQNIDLLLYKIFNLIQDTNLKSLTCDQLYFVIWCFFEKLDNFLQLVVGDDDGIIETDADMDKYWVEFDEIFINKAARIQANVQKYYRQEDKQKLIECVRDTMHIYKEAKQWMIKKGYNI